MTLAAVSTHISPNGFYGEFGLFNSMSVSPLRDTPCKLLIPSQHYGLFVPCEYRSYSSQGLSDGDNSYGNDYVPCGNPINLETIHQVGVIVHKSWFKEVESLDGFISNEMKNPKNGAMFMRHVGIEEKFNYWVFGKRIKKPFSRSFVHSFALYQ